MSTVVLTDAKSAESWMRSEAFVLRRYSICAI